MATVDSLDIKIATEAKNAESALDSLIGKLGTLESSLKSVSKIPIKIKIDDSAINFSKLKYAFSKALGDTKVDTSKIGEKIADSFNIAGKKAAKNISSQFQSAIETAVDSFDGSNLKLKIPKSFIESIASSGKIAKSELTSSLDGMQSEYEEFYNYFKTHKIYVSDFLKADIGKTEFSDILERNLSNITRRREKGIDLNADWAELSQRFPTILSGDTANAADQLISVLQGINEARDKIKPVSIQSLFGEDYDAAIRNIKENVMGAANEASEILRKSASKIASTPGTGLIIDTKINEDAIMEQIKSAIRKASKIKYEPVRVNIGVDSNKISSDLKGALQGIDIGSLAGDLSALGSITVNTEGINSLASAISKLGGKSATQATANLPRISRDLVEFATNLNSIGAVSFDASGLSNIIAEIRKLGGKSATQATANLPQLSKDIQAFVRELNDIQSLTFDTTGLSELISAISKLGGKSVSNVITNLPQLGSALKDLISALSSVPKVSQNTIQMTQALAQLSRGGGKVSTAMPPAKKSILNFGNAISGSAKKSDSLTKSFGGLASRITALYFKLHMLIRGFKLFGKAVTSAMDYVETLNYFNAAFRQVAENADLSGWKDAGYESAELYADSFKERAKELTQKMTGLEVSDTGDLTRAAMPSLGLDPEKTMQYQATFAQMSSSMGVASDTAVKLSNALTMIGADLASVRNMDFNKVWEDMASGLVGMSRTWDKYGVNIRNANLQQELNNLGMDESISKLNQQDKAILRTIVLLKSTKYAWADLSNTINQPANQLRLLQANFSSLARTIGSLFIPVITKVLPYINGFVIASQRLFAWIGKLLGINLSDFTASIGGISDSASGLLDMADGADDASSAIDDATKSTKKLEKALSVLPFDELNQLTAPAKDDSDKDKNKIVDLSVPLGSALDDILSEYQTAWGKAFGEMSNKANKIANKIAKAFKKIADAAEPTTEAIKKLWNQGLKKLGNFTWGTLKDFWNNFLKPIGKWMLSNDSGLPRFFNITNDLLNKINWDKLKQSLADFYTSLKKPTKFVWTALMDFYENFLEPVAVWVMGPGITQLIDALTEFNNNIHWKELNEALKNFWDALAPFAIAVGQGLVNFFKDLLKVGADFINKVVPDGLNSLSDALKNIKPETAEKIGWALGELLTAITGFRAITWIGEIIGKKSPLGKGLSFLAKHPYLATAAGIGGIVLALDKFGVIDVDWDWLWEKLKQIKDILAEFIEKIDFPGLSDALGNLWRAFQPFAQGFADALIGAFDFFLNDIGVHLLNALVDIFNALAKALGTMSPGELKLLGEAFFAVATGIKAIKIADKLIANLGLLKTGLINAGGAATSSSISWTVLGKAIGVVTAAFIGLKIGMKLTEVTTSTNQDLDDTSTHLANLTTVIGELGEQGEITKEQQSALNDKIGELADKGASPVESLTALRDALQEAGISSDALKTAAHDAGVDLSDLTTILKDAESGGEATKRGLNKAGDAAGGAGGKFGELAKGAKGATSILNDIDLEPAKGEVKSLQDKVDGVNFDNIPNKTTKAINETNTIWTNRTPDISNSVENALVKGVSLGDKLKEKYSGYAAFSVDGYNNKIKELEGETKTTMQNFAFNGILKAFMDKLGIHSPSTVFAGYGSNIVAGLKSGIENNSGEATRSISTLGSNLQSSLDGTLRNIETNTNNTIRNLGSSFSNAEIDASNSANRISNIFSGIHIPLPHIGFDWDSLDFGDFSFSIPRFKIDWYAKGGLFNRPSVVGIGEAGPEAILPLSNPKTMSMIAESIYDNAPNNAGFDKKELVDAIVEGVVMAMMSNQHNQPPVNVNCYATLQTDNETLARAVAKGQSSNNYRMSPTYG